MKESYIDLSLSYGHLNVPAKLHTVRLNVFAAEGEEEGTDCGTI